MKLQTLINKHKNIKEFFDKALGDYADDISNHGADQGYPYITYHNDTELIYDAFESDIWDMLRESANNSGYDNVMALIATFNRSDMPLMVKIMYQFMNNKKCPSGYEHDAIAYIRDNLNNRDNLDFDTYATMNKQESNA